MEWREELWEASSNLRGSRWHLGLLASAALWFGGRLSNRWRELADTMWSQSHLHSRDHDSRIWDLQVGLPACSWLQGMLRGFKTHAPMHAGCAPGAGRQRLEVAAQPWGTLRPALPPAPHAQRGREGRKVCLGYGEGWQGLKPVFQGWGGTCGSQSYSPRASIMPIYLLTTWSQFNANLYYVVNLF